MRAGIWDGMYRTDAEVPAEARGVCDQNPRAIKIFLDISPRIGNN